MAEQIELSQAAFDRLQAEYDDLTMRGRAEIAKLIERARELGDLKENGDYHAAKDDQGKMEARIRQLKAMLDHASIKEAGGGGVVASGSVVEIRYEGDDDTEKYLVGSIEERRDDLSVISPGSPLGQVLVGHVAGDTVEYQAPGGALKVEIVEVT
jgi:transcription elongation factor GreA